MREPEPAAEPQVEPEPKLDPEPKAKRWRFGRRAKPTPPIPAEEPLQLHASYDDETVEEVLDVIDVSSTLVVPDEAPEPAVAPEPDVEPAVVEIDLTNPFHYEDAYADAEDLGETEAERDARRAARARAARQRATAEQRRRAPTPDPADAAETDDLESGDRDDVVIELRDPEPRPANPAEILARDEDPESRPGEPADPAESDDVESDAGDRDEVVVVEDPEVEEPVAEDEPPEDEDDDQEPEEEARRPRRPRLTVIWPGESGSSVPPGFPGSDDVAPALKGPTRSTKSTETRGLRGIVAAVYAALADPLAGADEAARERRAVRIRKAGVVTGSAVFAAVLVYTIFPVRTYLDQRAATRQAQEERDILSEANEKLAERAEELHTPEEIEERAREDYGLVYPEEESYRVLPPPVVTTAPTTTTTIPPLR